MLYRITRLRYLSDLSCRLRSAIFLAVVSLSSGGGIFFHWHWEVVLLVRTLITGSGNALCILFPTSTLAVKPTLYSLFNF
nr:hypothetical protein [Tanacetum cinerariifolium]